MDEINYIERDERSGEYYWHYYPNDNLKHLPELEISEADSISDVLLRAQMILKKEGSIENGSPFDLITFNLVAETLDLEESMAGYIQLWELIKDYFKISFYSIKCLEALAGTELVERLEPQKIKKETEWLVHVKFTSEDKYSIKT